MRGPSAPWADADEEDVYPLVLRRTADSLASKLELRVHMLRSDSVTLDEVASEIRRMIATCALDDPLGASDMADLLLELMWAKENTRRL